MKHYQRGKYFSRNIITILVIIVIVLVVAYFTIGLKFSSSYLTENISEDKLPCEDDVYETFSKEEQIRDFDTTFNILDWKNFSNKDEGIDYFENKYDVYFLGDDKDIPNQVNYLILIREESKSSIGEVVWISVGYCSSEDFIWVHSLKAY